MPNIDYSKLHSPKRPSPCGHSVRNSFYLQKTKEIPGLHKAYHEYDTSGMIMTIISAEENSTSEDKKE